MILSWLTHKGVKPERHFKAKDRALVGVKKLGVFGPGTP